MGCTYGAAMATEPTMMAFSADGSLYVKDVTWQGWGTGRAVGTGIAEADNCQPNCAQGTYSKHPATITLTDPEPWHGKFAYSCETESVPAIGWHYAFTHGLVPTGKTERTPPPPAASPSSSPQAMLSSTCQLGYDNNGALLPNTAANSRAGDPTAQLVTLTNTGSVGANLASYEVEITWHGQTVVRNTIYLATPIFLTPGQSYTSPVTDLNTLTNVVDVTESTYLDGQCSVAAWYTP